MSDNYYDHLKTTISEHEKHISDFQNDIIQKKLEISCLVKKIKNSESIIKQIEKIITQ